MTGEYGNMGDGDASPRRKAEESGGVAGFRRLGGHEIEGAEGVTSDVLRSQVGMQSSEFTGWHFPGDTMARRWSSRGISRKI